MRGHFTVPAVSGDQNLKGDIMKKRPDYKNQVLPYYRNAIDVEALTDYGNKPLQDNSEHAIFQRLADTYWSEVGKWRTKQLGANYQNCFIEWLQGLPSVLNLAFMNYDIIQLSKRWGSLAESATEKEEDKIIDNWWRFSSMQLSKLAHRSGVEIFNQ